MPRLLASMAFLISCALISAPSGYASEPGPRRGAPPTAAQTAALCDAAGAYAARQTGVPYPVLQAITLTETGRKLEGRQRAWPWTVNMEGVGKWFATREEALAYAKAHFARGARSFDVGCFQINYRWHGNAFRSIDDMFDPKINALYAGQFLSRLYAETGNWSRAAGAYHSRTPKYATKYAARFDRILAGLSGRPPPSHDGAEYAHNMEAASPLPLSETQHLAAAPNQAPDPPRPALPLAPPPPRTPGSVALTGLVATGTTLLRSPAQGLY